jgi:ABC-type multidrug transport system ATPase subunit
MTLLLLERVSKRYSSARRECVALRDVSLDVAPGELVAVWGVRRSGRTTLLRVAAGMQPPDSGRVVFDGVDLPDDRSGLLGTQIGFCNLNFGHEQGGAVVDHVAISLLAHGVPRDRARARADAALARVEAADCADLDPRELDAGEQVRAGIARALVSKPRLLLIDEPINGVGLLQRDPIVELLRSLADEGTAILMTTSEAVSGMDRMLTIDDGEVRGEAIPEEAPVVPLRPLRAERSG